MDGWKPAGIMLPGTKKIFSDSIGILWRSRSGDMTRLVAYRLQQIRKEKNIYSKELGYVFHIGYAFHDWEAANSVDGAMWNDMDKIIEKQRTS